MDTYQWIFSMISSLGVFSVLLGAVPGAVLALGMQYFVCKKYGKYRYIVPILTCIWVLFYIAIAGVMITIITVSEIIMTNTVFIALSFVLPRIIVLIITIIMAKKASQHD
ncbi:hypothetical protein [Tannockella kyphosi]|uniref:hypothetical protein n=1 Tax=Tannockella kyphosi TaxID=2899121 RepID=UPI002011411D|nr:hypothetical protein [Tannockella kyphosi]